MPSSHARLLPDLRAETDLDRAMLARFADLASTARVGPVADLGCGTGRVTAHLNSLGVEAFGVDLSPAMVQQARQAHPALHFEVGSITALRLPDATVALRCRPPPRRAVPGELTVEDGRDRPPDPAESEEHAVRWSGPVSIRVTSLFQA